MIQDAENRKNTAEAARLALRLLAETSVLAMALSLVAAASISASAASYYVDSANGSDSNNGSITSPWQYIDTSMHKLAPGDILYLRNGSYGMSPGNTYGYIIVRTSAGDDGAVGALKTVTVYPGETATITAPIWIGANYWKFDHLVLTQMITAANEQIALAQSNWVNLNSAISTNFSNTTMPLSVWPHDIQITNCVFNNVSGASSGALHMWASNVLIQNNNFSGVRSASNSSQSENLYLSAGDNVVVRGNIITGQSSYGLQAFDQARVSGEMYNRILSNFIFENNVVYSPAGGFYAVDGTGPYVPRGMIIAAASGAGTYAHAMGQNITVRNNIVYGVTQAGILVDSGWDNVKIYNNTVFQPTGGAPCYNERNVVGAGPSTNVSVENNVFDLGASYSTSYHVATNNLGFNLNANLYWPTPIKMNGGTTVDSNPIQGDPLFANASADPALANFHLTAGSAAIDKGLSLAADVPGDKDGVCRPQPVGGAFDIGAYEFCPSGSCPATCGSGGSGTIVNALPPAPPRGFHLQ